MTAIKHMNSNKVDNGDGNNDKFECPNEGWG